MNALRLAAVGALLGGLALLAFAVLEGDVRVGFFLIIPFVYGTGVAAFFGMALLFAALVLWSFSRLDMARAERSEPADASTERRSSSGVVLLGPIPIVWGNARALPWMIAAGAALLVLAIVVAWGFR